MIQRISVIGAGAMGNGIAHVFAINGFDVNLIDTSRARLEKAVSIIDQNLERQVSKILLTQGDKAAALSRISSVISISEGVKNAELVIEAATEDPKIKMEIFRKLDAHAPSGCILASNTSSISITEIASATNRPEDVIGMHFMNPVPVMKLVEIINGYSTSALVTKNIVDLCYKLGKVPCEVNDYPGFIANRILMPMINEAIFALHEGVSGVEQIDTIMKLGMSHPMGPLQLADFIGLDVCHAILKILHNGMGNQKYAPCPLLTKMVQAGHLGIKSGEGFYSYSSGSKEFKVSKRFS